MGESRGSGRLRHRNLPGISKIRALKFEGFVRKKGKVENLHGTDWDGHHFSQKSYKVIARSLCKTTKLKISIEQIGTITRSSVRKAIR